MNVIAALKEAETSTRTELSKDLCTHTHTRTHAHAHVHGSPVNGYCASLIADDAAAVDVDVNAVTH